MVIGRGPRPGGDGSRSGAVPVGASGGPAARLRQQPWTDPRLVLGVLLVLGATVLGASVVAAADDTEAYWALARDVEAGDPVRRGDLVETRARVDGDAAGALLRTDQALPGRLEALQWSRAGAEGALVGRADLVADPSLIPQAVEEVLRFEGPSPVQARFTTEDVTLHDVTIPARSVVLLLTSSAGRDERQYGPDAGVFDIHREQRHHVSVGYGVHFCLGASLARLQS
ncbi:cytochrome P450, partial [uncultured Aeromicrobium sp.]|uniref:cytochrome P450 n=1 Tax=uncultured Aeromicrobium sp. TaxID=337820 RepID=UPI002597592D